MARFARTPVARLVVSGVVFVVIVVSVVQYKRHGGKPTGGTTPSASLAVNNVPKPAIDPTPPAKPFTTQTPNGPTTHGTAVAPPDPAPPANPTADVAAVLADAKAKSATDPYAARKELNDALLGGGLSAGDADAVKRQMADLSAVLVFSTRQFPDDPLGGVYAVEPGNKLQKIANQYDVTYPLLMDLNGLADASKMQAGQTLKVVRGPFHAVVTRATFTLDLYFGGPGGPGSTYVTSYPVSLGTAEKPTPTGTWVIGKGKAANAQYDRGTEHMRGGDAKNPIGAYWLPLEGVSGNAVGQRGYGIHGTIDSDSVGKAASLGCVRLRNEDVAEIYKLLISGKSKVVVKE